MNKDLELKNEVYDLLKFVITLNVFFLSIIETLFKYNDTPVKHISEIKLQWAASVAILICCFLMFKLLTKDFSSLFFKISKILLLLENFLFVPPLIILATDLNTITTYTSYYILTISLWGLVMIPIFILFVTVIWWLFCLFKGK